MKKVCLFFWIFMASITNLHSQSGIEKLSAAVSALEKDPQLRHGILGFYVIDAKTGKTVFQKNAQTGLAPASTQKVITSATAFEMLGNDFNFQTQIGYDGEIKDGKLAGNLYIIGNGDPTLGSWRWHSTSEEEILDRIVDQLEKKLIRQIDGDIMIDDASYTFQPLPDGWIWQDIGNYYGAGAWSLNWRENQYDLILQSGKEQGSQTTIVKTVPGLFNFNIANFITAGPKNSGDNGYIYASPFSDFGYTTGTIPLDEKAFSISGSLQHPGLQFSRSLEQKLRERKIGIAGEFQLYSELLIRKQVVRKPAYLLDSILSPTLDSMNYWFMRKSINLYGEAFVKQFSVTRKANSATTETGVEIIKGFWSDKGIEKTAINIIDGSGLSPQNRVTPHALVKVLQFAKTRSWFDSFYTALPVFNGMKIKSGSIGGARSFAGYHISAKGKEYIFAIIVNNYNGSSAEIVKKLYRVLDFLK
jgi:D-alanyl-D-alanine carboxypeptidase/D-alanyl-D-alanine-endopeptidase (penicillin-binding protein 4)